MRQLGSSAFAGDSGLVPSIHVGQLTSFYNSSSMGSDPFLASSGTCTNVADTYTHKEK